MKPLVERWLERGLFASRWLMTPFYIGLLAALFALMYAFFQEIAHAFTMFAHPPEGEGNHLGNDAIMMALSLIDLSLAANLVLIVIFSGYENFVSKIDTGEHEDRPGWMGTVDFSGLKLKLIASIVAISVIALLRAFLEVNDQKVPFEPEKIMWMVIVHLTFVASGVVLAFMDFLTSKSGKH